MSKGSASRVFSREFKLSVVRRMLAGENVSAMARELKVLRKDLYVWRDRFRAGGPEALRSPGRPRKAVAMERPPDPPPDPGGTRALTQARRRIAELERKIGQQQVDLDFFSASLAAGQGGTPGERRTWRHGVYTVIQAMTPQPQGEIGIERMCRLAEVSRAGYYRHWQASAPRREETGLRDAIQQRALAHRHYGYRRIAALLSREGWRANHKRVLRLMREDNLLCLRKAAFVPTTTDSRHGWRVVPNLARNLELTGLDQLWVADITYLHLAEEFAYLAIVLDGFSRRGVGWALETHLQASLAITALAMAIAARQPAPGSLIHHSDRGVQYACGDYARLLA